MLDRLNDKTGGLEVYGPFYIDWLKIKLAILSGEHKWEVERLEFKRQTEEFERRHRELNEEYERLIGRNPTRAF